jgi:hypothetical protein
MKKKIALTVVGAAMTAGLVFGIAAPASAEYLTGFNTYSDCSWSAYGKRLQGATITQGCTYRSYDGKWAYSYEWPIGHGM